MPENMSEERKKLSRPWSRAGAYLSEGSLDECMAKVRTIAESDKTFG